MSERTRNLPRRTCHATPGSNEKMLGKAPGLGADQVFLDLEVRYPGRWRRDDELLDRLGIE